MNVASPVRQWATELSKLAAGTTIAAFILIPTSSPAVFRTQSRSGEHRLEMVTSVPDGFFDPRMARFQTRTGLETACMPVNQPEEEEQTLLPVRLREVSRLPVATLAQLVGVSRVTYHNWLKGEGISEGNAFRLAGLLDVLRALHDLCGEGLGEFLEARGSLGRPIELLLRGETDAVLGLALRPANVETFSPIVEAAVWETSGLQGWIQPVASLNWDAPRLTDEELSAVLMEANPRPWIGADEAMDASDESPFVAHIQFVG